MARRSLHLVDLENLVGDPFAPADVALRAFDAYLRVAEWAPDDQVIVASNPGLMRGIVFDLPVPCSPHCARGRDGADRALLSLAPLDLIVRRYDRLVIGSGDGIFASLARASREQGVHVLVVARVDGCSGRLRRFERRFIEPALLPVAA